MDKEGNLESREVETVLPRLAPGRYYGEGVTEKTLGEWTISEWLHPPHQHLTCHTHEQAYLSFVLRGAYTELCERRTLECTPTYLILHPAGEVHADRFHSTGGHLFNIEITADWTRKIEALAPALSRRIETQDGRSVGLMRRIVREFRHADAVSSLAIEGLTLELLAVLARQNSVTSEAGPPRWLAQITDRLHGDFLNSWTLTQLAAEAGVHPTHLARAFRQHYRCSVGDYIRQLRIQFACARLTDTDHSLGEIAQETGFADQSHFGRIFKRSCGVTPAVYRQTARRR